MLQDQSPDKIDTMNFLERRLNDFQAFGSVRNTVKKEYFFFSLLFMNEILGIKIFIRYCTNS
jgi:hypothetical protein